jgi:osmotically-inducible protein OsmY
MFKRFSVVVCGLGVVLLTAGAASAQSATQETKAKTKSTAQKTGMVMSDAEITSAVKSKLLADKIVGGLKLDVDTKDGVVTLSGPVHSAAERAQAVKLARGTHGVKSVTSKLVVEKTTDTTTGTSGKDDKGTHIIIKDDTTPMVKKGAEKTKEAVKKTVDAVKDTDVKVKDDTKVEIHKDDGDPAVKTAGEATADAAITSAVKTKLLADARVSGLKIDVDTSKGVVTLTGNVANQTEKAAALDLAKSTKGVTRVVDKLTIK